MSLPPSFFDDMYAAAEDPWSMRTRWYEQRKYALTTAVLPRARYAEALEVGCSVGELTARLAGRDAPLNAVFKSMASSTRRKLMVVEGRRLVGVISLSDLMHHLALEQEIGTKFRADA